MDISDFSFLLWFQGCAPPGVMCASTYAVWLVGAVLLSLVVTPLLVCLCRRLHLSSTRAARNINYNLVDFVALRRRGGPQQWETMDRPAPNMYTKTLFSWDDGTGNWKTPKTSAMLSTLLDEPPGEPQEGTGAMGPSSRRRQQSSRKGPLMPRDSLSSSESTESEDSANEQKRDSNVNAPEGVALEQHAGPFELTNMGLVPVAPSKSDAAAAEVGGAEQLPIGEPDRTVPLSAKRSQPTEKLSQRTQAGGSSPTTSKGTSSSSTTSSASIRSTSSKPNNVAESSNLAASSLNAPGAPSAFHADAVVPPSRSVSGAVTHGPPSTNFPADFESSSPVQAKEKEPENQIPLDSSPPAGPSSAPSSTYAAPTSVETSKPSAPEASPLLPQPPAACELM